MFLGVVNPANPYEAQYLLDAQGRCVSWHPSGGGSKPSNTPCKPGLYGQTARTQQSVQPISFSAPGKILDYRADTGWNPAEADAAFRELTALRNELNTPVSGGDGQLQQPVGASLPSAPAMPAALQIEEFQAAPELIAPVTVFSAPAQEEKSDVPMAAVVAAGVLAFLWMSS